MRALRLTCCAVVGLIATGCLRESTIEPVRETVMVHGMANVGSTRIGIALASVSTVGVATPLSGATVTLHRGDASLTLAQSGTASSFCFAPTEYELGPGAQCYTAVLGTPIGAGETLDLDIELPDGSHIVGSTTTPQPPVLAEPLAGDDVQVEFVLEPFPGGGYTLEGAPLEVRWSGTGGAPADVMLDVGQLFDDGAAVDCSDVFFGGARHGRSPAYLDVPVHCTSEADDPVWDSAYVDLVVVGYDDNARAYIAAIEESGAGVVLEGASPGLAVTAADRLVSGVFGSATRTVAPLTLRATLVIEEDAANGSRASGAPGRGAAAP